MKYTLGIDLGTSYFKLGLFNENGDLCGLGRVTVETDKGDGSRCELPSDRFKELLSEGLVQACRQAKASPSDVKAVGYSSQANSFVLLDKNDKPLTPLILWPDERSKEIHPKVSKLWQEDDFLQTTGIGADCSCNLCVNKLLLFKHGKPDIWEKIGMVMTISDYLTFLFTGQKIGDMGTVSLLGLFDCKNTKWWNKAFDILEFNKTMFPRHLKAGTKIGNTDTEFAKSIGIKADTSFYTGSFDHHMAALGAGVQKTTDMSISIGTVLACVNITDKYKPVAGVCISPWKDNKYCQLAFDGNGAKSLEWYQQNFAKKSSLEELVKMAENAGSSNSLVAKPQAFKYKNITDVFNNIKDEHDHGHFIYALMESSANTLAELIQKLSPNEKPERIFATGGGAKSDLWLKIISEMTGCNITLSKHDEPATSGAALLSIYREVHE